MNWSYIRHLLHHAPVVHFRAGEHRISIGNEGQPSYPRSYVIFIDFRLEKARVMFATDIMRKVLRPKMNTCGVITHYHFRDHGVDNIIARLKTVPDLQLIEDKVSV